MQQPNSTALGHQGGWVGLIALLIALVIVALLAQTVLKSYGFLAGPEPPAKAGPRSPGPAAAAAGDPTSAPPAPTNPIERARGLEQQVQRDARDLGKRIDEQTK
jgi:cytochrome c-type biogenesis protein CcmH/NrfG